MRVAIVGAGAVGSVLGARLSEASHEVLLIGRAEHVATIREVGLRVTGAIHGTFRLRAEETLPPDFGPEAILWTVKTFDIASTAELLVRGSPRPVATLLPQNGLGVELQAAEALRSAGWPTPERVLVRAVSSIPATFLAPGKIRAAGRGDLVLPVPQGENAAATRRMVELFSSAGITLRSSPTLPREVWHKAVLNAAINPVTARHSVTNGRLREEPFRTEAVILLTEARRAAEAAGFSFAESELISDLDRVLLATADNRSSMLQDVERGRPTEIDSISGELLRTAEHAGFDLPVTRQAVAEFSHRVREPPAAERGKQS